MSTLQRHAFLPESLEPQQPTIGTMCVGDQGYVTPWTMQVDADRRCWLNATTEVYQDMGGTVKMWIVRRVDGWHVWAPPGETWRPKAHDPGERVPVVEIHVDAR